LNYNRVTPKHVKSDHASRRTLGLSFANGPGFILRNVNIRLRTPVSGTIATCMSGAGVGML